MSNHYRINIANNEETDPIYEPTILLLDMLEYAGIDRVPDVNKENYLNVVEWFESFHKANPDYDPDKDSEILRDYRSFNWDTIMGHFTAKYNSPAGTLDAKEASVKWSNAISNFAHKADNALQPKRNEFTIASNVAAYSYGMKDPSTIKGKQVHDAYKVQYAQHIDRYRQFKEKLNPEYREYLKKVAKDFGITIENHHLELQTATKWGGGKKSKKRKSKKRKSKSKKRKGRKSKRRH